MNKTIKLSTQGNKTYYATDATEQQIDAIVQNQNNPEGLKAVCDKLKISTNIDLVGSVAEASYYLLSRYVGYLKGYAPRLREDNNYNVQYRDYTKSEERQLKTAHLVKVCEDAKTSARTAIKAMELDYMIIWHREHL